MNYRIIGAILVVLSSSAVGFSMVTRQKQEQNALLQLIRGLEFMACELEFRMPSLPELCNLTAFQLVGPIRKFYVLLEAELEKKTSNDVYGCVCSAVEKVDKMPENVKQNLLLMGRTLGRFDLTGQLSGIASVRELCKRDLEGLQSNQEIRFRAYRTLGICAGIALVILFI